MLKKKPNVVYGTKQTRLAVHHVLHVHSGFCYSAFERKLVLLIRPSEQS